MRRLVLLVAVGCAHAQASPLRPGALVIFGELHGTSEIPQFFGDTVADAARSSRVHVGLELSGDGGPLWTDAFQSGRTSEAMAKLIARLRALPAVELFYFDSTATDRDGAMADAISAERQKAPQDLFLVLVGNLHARKKPGAPWDPGIRWMSVRLAERERDLVTLDARYSSGTAWICQGTTPQDCRETKLRGSAESARGIAMQPQPEGYDGVYFVGPISASPPARR